MQEMKMSAAEMQAKVRVLEQRMRHSGELSDELVKHGRHFCVELKAAGIQQTRGSRMM